MADTITINGQVDEQPADVQEFSGADKNDRESNVSQIIGKIEDLEREKEELISENDEIKDKMKKLTLELDQLKSDEQQMKEKLDGMEKEMDHSDEEKKLLESVAARAVELETEVARLQHDLITAMNEGDEASAEVGELKEQLGEKGLKIEELDKEIVSLNKAKAESEKRLRELERNIGVLEMREMEEKSKKLRMEEEMRDRINEKEKEISGFKKKVDELESEVNRTGVLLQTSMAEKKAMEEALKESEEKARTMDAKILLLQNEVGEAEKLVNDLKERKVELINGNTRNICGTKGLDFPTIAAGSTGAVLVAAAVVYLYACRRP